MHHDRLNEWTNYIQTKGRTANKVLPKAGLTCYYDSSVLNQTLVFQLNFSAKIPAFGNTQSVREYAEIAWLSLHSWCPAVGHGNRPADRYTAFIVCFLWPSVDFEAEWPVAAAEACFVSCSLPGSIVSGSARNDCPTILQPSLGF